MSDFRRDNSRYRPHHLPPTDDRQQCRRYCGTVFRHADCRPGKCQCAECAVLISILIPRCTQEHVHLLTICTQIHRTREMMAITEHCTSILSEKIVINTAVMITGGNIKMVDHYRCIPPSTYKELPVMYRPTSEQSSSAAAAQSSAAPA